jgi:hypothetical protein
VFGFGQGAAEGGFEVGVVYGKFAEQIAINHAEGCFPGIAGPGAIDGGRPARQPDGIDAAAARNGRNPKEQEVNSTAGQETPRPLPCRREKQVL